MSHINANIIVHTVCKPHTMGIQKAIHYAWTRHCNNNIMLVVANRIVNTLAMAALTWPLSGSMDFLALEESDQP